MDGEQTMDRHVRIHIASIHDVRALFIKLMLDLHEQFNSGYISSFLDSTVKFPLLSSRNRRGAAAAAAASHWCDGKLYNQSGRWSGSFVAPSIIQKQLKSKTKTENYHFVVDRSANSGFSTCSQANNGRIGETYYIEMQLCVPYVFLCDAIQWRYTENNRFANDFRNGWENGDTAARYSKVFN